MSSLAGERGFRLYVAAWFLFNLGSQMLSVSVGWQVYALTHRAIDLGYVGLVQVVPVFALLLVAGAAADRFDRGRIVAACDVALGACALALGVLASLSHNGVAPLYGILFVVGIARAFGEPAAQALVPELVPREQLSRAVTWTSTVWQVSTIMGPAVGGLLYGFAHGAAGVDAAAGLAFVLAALLTLAIGPRLAMAREAAGLKNLLAGLRFVRAHRVILESITLDLFSVLLGGATALLPIYASDILHVGPAGLGLLRSAPALGAAGMAVVLARRPLERGAGRATLGAAAIFGMATVVFGLSRSFGLSLAALLFLGAADMVSVVVRSTVVQLQTPHAMRGRVGAVSTLCIAASSELGELESGLTAAWLGAVPAVVAGGLGTLVIAGLYALISELRTVDRLDAEGAPLEEVRPIKPPRPAPAVQRDEVDPAR